MHEWSLIRHQLSTVHCSEIEIGVYITFDADAFINAFLTLQIPMLLFFACMSIFVYV